MNTKIITSYEERKHAYQSFIDAISGYFLGHPKLNKQPLPIVHSIKSRLKDSGHLNEKIDRKNKEGKECITEENVYLRITDFAGVRILHLYQEQFIDIHRAIIEQISNQEWAFVEPPKAYTWDPEYKKQYESLDIHTEIKDTFYTSVHYIVKANNNREKPICCEIQVRTLFEEIWGEIDHTINYPNKTNSIACGEQLKVLARLISTGTRLADSIFKSHEEHKAQDG
ncbi:hypothetical protein ACUHGC_05605 [Testudinibacter sp. P27/CKL/0425]